MPIQQDHIIQRQVFDVRFPEREKVTDVQNRLSQLFNSRLSPLMSGLFDKHIPGNLLLRLDALELDLGSIAYSDLEEALTDRFASELENELTRCLLLVKNNPIATIPGMQVAARKTGFMDLLEHFLIRGFMPWWASSALGRDPEKILNDLLSQDPAAVKQLLLKAGKHANARRRLVYQFSESALRAVITLLEPGEAAFIFEYYRDILQIQRQKPAVKTETAGFEKEVMVFILSAIVVDRSSTFEKKMFVKNTLEQMAAHYNLAYENLLFLFSSATSHLTTHVEKTDHFPVLIRELFKEHIQSKTTGPAREIQPVEKISAAQTHVALLRHYLLFGSLPAWARPYEKAELRDLFSELITITPLLAGELMRVAAGREGAKMQLFYLMDEALFTQLVILAEKEAAGFILNYADVLTQFQLRISGSGVENTVIRQAVTESIFTFLFSARSPVFDQRMFLESTIKHTANRYGRSFQALLPVLAQFIGEKFKSHSPSAPLFYLVTGILKETEKPADIRSKTVTDISKAPAKQEETVPFLEVSQSVKLKDALLHFLVQGYLPWWIRDHFPGSPEKMLQELISRTPENGLLVLKLAATQHHAQRRLLTQFTPQTLLQVFKTLKDGSVAQAAFEALQEFTKTIAAFGVPDPEARYSILLFALWNTYAAENYQQFNATLFIEKALHHLSRKTGLPFEPLVKAFKQKGAFSFTNIPLTAPSAADVLDTGSEPPLADLLKTYLPAHKQLDKTLLLTASLDTLTYFLTWNKLPEQLSQLKSTALEDLLKQLLVLLSEENPNALKNLLHAPHLSSAARIRLHQAAALERNTAEKNAKILLSAFVERDMLQYLKEKSLMGSNFPTELRRLLQQTLDQKDSPGKKELLRTLLAAGDVSYLVTWQFSDETFYKTLAAIGSGVTSETSDLLQHLGDFIKSAITDTLEREKISVLLKEFSLYYFARQSWSINVSGFLSAFFKFLAARKQPGALVLFSSLLEASKHMPLSSPLMVSGNMVIIQEQLRQQIRFETQTQASVLDLRTADQSLAGNILRIDPAIQQTSDTTLLQQDLEQRHPMDQELLPAHLTKDSREKLYVQNAGLVLLHPFISTLFKRSGLTNNNQFITTEARHRAAYLLQYLALGRATYAEHDMVLNKLLCGLPIQQPLLPGILLTDSETGMALELLQEVTKQWEKLKNTSVAGLQASFLQRNALLMQNEDSWLMQVEQRGYDVLLQTLPWSFGMIKTPWMDKILYVEWT